MDSKPLTSAQLVHLSNLEVQELSEFIEAWAETSIERRRQTINMLNELTETNVELDFNTVYRYTLEDDDSQVREGSISGLWECEERSLIIQLIQLMNGDSEESVRAKATQAMGKFALLAETGKLLERDHRKIADSLLTILRDDGESTEVRRRAVEAIAPMSLPDVQGIIEEAYSTVEPHSIKASALYAMGLTCNPHWLPTLVTELSADNPEFRYEAISALAEIGEEEATTSLVPLIQDSDPQIQAAAIGALGAIGGSLAKNVLTQALQHEDDRIQELAAAALQSMDFDEDPLGFNDLA